MTAELLPTVRRRARSGRVRGLAHVVEVGGQHDDPMWKRLRRRALCGFTPRKSWADHDAPEWEDPCSSCVEALERRTG